MTTETNNNSPRRTHAMPHCQVMGCIDDGMDFKVVFASLWARKKFIGIGVFSFVFAATAIVFSMPDIYRVKTLVRPGIVQLGPEGKGSFAQGLESLKGQIEAGEFSVQHLSALKIKYPNSTYSQKALKVAIPHNSDALLITYDTTNPEFGKSVLVSLTLGLREKDTEAIKSIAEDSQSKIDNKKELQLRYKREQKKISSRIERLYRLYGEIENEVLDLMGERNSFITEPLRDLGEMKSSYGNLENALFHNSLVIQNRQFLLDLKKEQREINHEIIFLEEKQETLRGLTKEIREVVEKELKAIQNIEYFHEIMPVTTESHHVGPKREIIIFMSFVCGIFAMIFATFVVEYVLPLKK